MLIQQILKKNRAKIHEVEHPLTTSGKQSVQPNFSLQTVTCENAKYSNRARLYKYKNVSVLVSRLLCRYSPTSIIRTP